MPLQDQNTTATPPIEVPRDYLGRPKVTPPEGGKPKPYTRVSTLAKTLDDQYGLTSWKMRMTAIGVAINPSLLSRVSAVVNSHIDPVSTGKADLNELVEKATEAAGITRAADLGTAVHTMTEILDNGGTLTNVPDDLAPVLDAYRWGTAELEMLGTEVFVVCDELRAAGTLDRLVRLPDGRVVIGDVKTGKDEPKYSNGVATQIAVYAHGERYDPATGERTPLHPDLDLTTGLLIHLPLLPVDGKQVCDLYPLDLEAGWRKAQLACQVRAERKHPKLQRLVTV